MLKVSCIIINYNSSSYTLKCIESILKNNESSFAYEIIVIDNASQKNDYKILRKGVSSIKNDKVRLIRSNINTGFGGGNMHGLQFSSQSKYITFINNDCIINDGNLLKNLCDFMEKTPDAGICSPQAYDGEGKFTPAFDHFASVTKEILRRKTLETLFPKTYLNRKKQYKNFLKVDYVNGSFMFFRRKSFEKIGGFDTNLFLYYEEMDSCLRLQKKLNQYAYLLPQYSYTHFKGVSTSKNEDIKKEQKISLLYVISKHYSSYHRTFLLLYYIFRYGITSIFKPKYFNLFKMFLGGAHISKSLKQQQEIISEL